MSVNWLSLGLTSLSFLTAGVILSSTGRHGLPEWRKRPLLLAYSYRNALTLARACQADESGSSRGPDPAATERSPRTAPEEEEDQE
jgi:hypothetical protein